MAEPKSPQSVSQSGPLRKVVSSTADTVTLECGHILVLKKNPKPKSRRCPPCAGLRDNRHNRPFILRNS